MNTFIVYAAYDEETDECLYIGSGNEERYRHITSGISHVYEANRYHFQGRVPKVVIEHSQLSQEESFKLEKEMIIDKEPQ